jgi:3-hydroxyisobutyrate dehydrogenase
VRKRSTLRWRWPVGWDLKRIAGDDFSVQFALSLALKDVHLALEAAGDDRFAALARLAQEWQGVVEHGLGDQDLTIVTRALEEGGERR